MAEIRLKAGRERSILRRHPWIYSGAVAEVRGSPGTGETVDILDAHGEFLARGAYSPRSQIRCRIWSWKIDEKIDAAFFHARLVQAIQRRVDLVDESSTDAYRLVHAESDGLPGVIVDQYGQTCVAQFLSAGAERWRDEIVTALKHVVNPLQIFERSDVDVRILEGLSERIGLLQGQDIVSPVIIQENQIRFMVDIVHGHKTGFYLDQRDNRLVVQKLARSRAVLDCFCYTGGFSLAALVGGASSVVAVDTSENALALLHKNAGLNGLAQDHLQPIHGDVFQVLRTLRDQNRKFDMVVLDPPKFAPTSAQASKAARGYKDINLLGLKLLRRGGMLITFSCSGGVSAELFQKIVAGAALDAGINAGIVAWLHQGSDHPVALNFPEGSYLKGLVLQV